MGATAQRSILDAGSQLIVETGSLRIVSACFIFGTVTIRPAASIVFASHELSAIGRLDRTAIVNAGMLFVNSGSLLIQSPLTGDGGFSIGPGAAATIDSPQSQTVFQTDVLNNGGDCHVNGVLTFRTGVARFVTPLQGVGQIIIGEGANVQLDGTVGMEATNTQHTSHTNI